MLPALAAYLTVFLTGLLCFASLMFMTSWVVANLMPSAPAWCAVFGGRKTDKTSWKTALLLLVAALTAIITSLMLTNVGVVVDFIM